jgi:hypothetical protein
MIAFALTLVAANAFQAPPAISPTTALESTDVTRRRILGTPAAAGLLSITDPLPALAAKQPRCMPGTFPGSDLGIPATTIAMFEHDTPSYASWHKVLQSFGKDLLSVYPPEMKVIDEFFVKTKSERGDGVMAGLIFETSALKECTKFFDEKTNPIVAQGRKEGWITGKWRANYFNAELVRNGKKELPPLLEKGQAIVYGGHGIPGKFEDWAAGFGSPDADKFHESLNILNSVAGHSIGSASTDVTSKNGVGAIHCCATIKDAERFKAAFDEMKPGLIKDGILTEPYYLSFGEVMYKGDDFAAPGLYA